MFETFSFASPFFLILFPLFVLLNFLSKKKQHVYYMPHIRYYQAHKNPTSSWPFLLKWMMICFAIFALCDPLYYKSTPVVKNNAIDIVLALDSSGSMRMYGFNPKAYKQTRLDVVKEVVSDFVKQRTNDRIGLVVFGTHSTIASPLSFDKEAQQYIIRNLKIGRLGKSTALVDAIVSSVKALKESKSTSKIIILLSDGEDSSSQVPLSVALKLVKKYGIKVYTIMIDKSHSNMLQLIAKSSHTKVYTPKNKEALKEVYTTINQLEKSHIHYQTIKIPQHLYGYFLGMALLCGFALLLVHKNEVIL